MPRSMQMSIDLKYRASLDAKALFGEFQLAIATMAGVEKHEMAKSMNFAYRMFF